MVSGELMLKEMPRFVLSKDVLAKPAIFQMPFSPPSGTLQPAGQGSYAVFFDCQLPSGRLLPVKNVVGFEIANALVIEVELVSQFPVDTA